MCVCVLLFRFSRSRLGGRLYPIKDCSPDQHELGTFIDLGASYWHSCRGDSPTDRRNQRLPQRSISGLAKIYKPKVKFLLLHFYHLVLQTT